MPERELPPYTYGVPIQVLAIASRDVAERCTGALVAAIFCEAAFFCAPAEVCLPEVFVPAVFVLAALLEPAALSEPVVAVDLYPPILLSYPVRVGKAQLAKSMAIAVPTQIREMFFKPCTTLNVIKKQSVLISKQKNGRSKRPKLIINFEF